MVRQGAIDSPPKCPIILGFECAGEIEQVGEGVEGFAVSTLYFLFREKPSQALQCKANEIQQEKLGKYSRAKNSANIQPNSHVCFDLTSHLGKVTEF